jgi:phosphomannomutase
MPDVSVYSKMFKAYDVRGTFPEINEGVYYWTGYAFVKLILQPENLPLKVNLVRDSRYTSPAFYKALYNGIKDAGGEPVALGLGSTDFLYAACQTFNTPGIMVTASHNPKNDNGMKIVKVAPNSVGLESGLDKIRDFVIKEMTHTNLDELATTFLEPTEEAGAKSQVTQFFENKLENVGSAEEIDLFLTQNNQKLKVVVDTANGMGGWFMPNLSGMYENIEFIPLYWELDGQFPNHPADPLKPENLKDLQKLVLEQKADLGVAFDGDADRAFFVDEKGERIDGNFLVSVFAQTLIQDVQKNPASPSKPAAVYSVTGSRCMPESINEVGGVAVPSKQGHTYFKKLMSDYRAVYGGEFTGHHYFADFGYMDSGFLALVLFLKTLVISGKTVSELFTSFKTRYYLSEELVLQIPEGQTFESLVAKVKTAFKDAVSIHEVDGIAVFYSEWKFNLRPSNTEPVLRFLLESKRDDFEFNVERKVADVRAVLGC